ncbi:MAG TPA: sigma-70 family RNA polymerase sigma factor [Bacteroidetes bacterium]|nr:sigma-70 family RNA polymerase sigma factor [Bacteroidota bacterium]
MTQKELIPHLFRTEYSKIVAVLCKIFGLSNIQIAEDIVGDTFLLAAETWGLKGVPENQTGWLYTVAKNKTKDYLKRNKLYVQKIEPELIFGSEKEYLLEIDLSEKNITDSQLQMLFAICHPSISPESQIGLALRILCGFGIDEIAEAFLTKKETINKRLFRAKENLRKKNIKIQFPKETELLPRLDNVLRTLYLLFNEGYYSAAPNKTLRKDFCAEAMRLTLMLSNNNATCKPKVNALFSLMCFHASRFEARIDYNGAFILYQDQDKNLWDNGLIQKGTYYLNRSSAGKDLSKYHLEAAIAYWHTQKNEGNDKWENILQLYNYLLQIEYSPVAALNRTYALAKANGTAQAIIEAEKINLKDSHLYHCLLADFYKPNNIEKAAAHLERAYGLAKSAHEKKLIKKRLKGYGKLSVPISE